MKQYSLDNGNTWHDTPLEALSKTSDCVLAIREGNTDVMVMFNATRLLHEFAIWCAEEALHLVDNPDPRLLNALDVKRQWLAGEATDEELADAFEAACAAARAAADAATYADYYADCAAAYAAADADYYAVYAAYAAYAALVAAYAKTYAAARKNQNEKLTQLIEAELARLA